MASQKPAIGSTVYLSLWNMAKRRHVPTKGKVVRGPTDWEDDYIVETDDGDRYFVVPGEFVDKPRKRG